MALSANEPIQNKVDDLIRLVLDADAKDNGGLFKKISEELIGKDNGSVVNELSRVLKGLQIIGKLNLPAAPTTSSQFKTEFALTAKQVLHDILLAHGQPGLSLASDLAMDLIMKSAHLECGAGKTINVPGQSIAQAIEGPAITRDPSDRDIIFYFIEEDGNGVPKLPPIGGDKVRARGALRRAFTKWGKVLKIATVPVAQQEKSHLLITGASLGGGSSLLARTDIGPPRGQQLRMLFNVDKTEMTEEEFIANVSHEFGHALGISHRDVDQNNESLVMHGTNLGVSTPTADDIAAAVGKGWRAIT